MRLSLREARRLDDAFTPRFPWQMQWLPMRELRQYPDEDKFAKALENLQSWKTATAARTRRQAAGEAASAKTRVLTVLMYASMAYCLLAGFQNWPPTSYVTAAYCSLFQTEEYHPLLSSLILMVPIALLFRALDPNIR
jgi:hypothetical protein